MIRALALAAAGWLVLASGAQAHEAHNKAVPAAVQKSPQPSATDPAPLPFDIGGPFALVDHNGRARSEQDFRGAYLLVFFGYAKCEGVCPVGLRRMTEALDLLGDRAARVTPILITVDPQNDTPDSLRRAVAEIHPRLIGLTGAPEALAAARKAYGVGSKRLGQSLSGNPIFRHGTFVYLMGPEGEFLSLFPPVMPPDAMAAAIRGYIG
jgi:protein SCO1/2